MVFITIFLPYLQKSFGTLARVEKHAADTDIISICNSHKRIRVIVGRAESRKPQAQNNRICILYFNGRVEFVYACRKNKVFPFRKSRVYGRGGIPVATRHVELVERQIFAFRFRPAYSARVIVRVGNKHAVSENRIISQKGLFTDSAAIFYIGVIVTCTRPYVLRNTIAVNADESRIPHATRPIAERCVSGKPLLLRTGIHRSVNLCIRQEPARGRAAAR